MLIKVKLKWKNGAKKFNISLIRNIFHFMAKKQVIQEPVQQLNVISFKNIVIILGIIIGIVISLVAFTGLLTQERLEDFTQNPIVITAKVLPDGSPAPTGPFAPKLSEPGKKILVSPKDVGGASGGGIGKDAELELTPEGPKYTYDVQNDEELQIVLAALFFHGKYLLPEAESITVVVNFPDKPSKTFTIPASTVDETREEHANFTQFYENVTTS